MFWFFDYIVGGILVPLTGRQNFLTTALPGTSGQCGLFFFFDWRMIALLLYNVVLVSAIHQHESAINIHISPLS